ncbi:AraC family transcriptional regulator [Lysobacter arseniciresistens ZS79]|uniref:AraC family transcriptional regulator n=1 Tax=Lysobacter arseniciresistens ZS79 TaxID=913325 RepID=A0A0A0EU84_9GAMM|nr:AraC family transcriptional regulator [Lysobacter arseniciresistens]KGM54466.1 AraC family transcriptional regulator [Lysobacter arseniciresistens ZS79]
MDKVLWADRGQLQQLDSTDHELRTRCIGVSRLGSAQVSAQQFSVWVQLRGSAWIQSREGRFHLRRGDWIAFDRDSRPEVQADRHGLCLGIALGAEAQKAIGRIAELTVFAGRGRVGHRDARTFARLWRAAGPRLSAAASGDGAAEVAALRPLLMHLAAIQKELTARIARCPGRSRQRKRQVFSRLQRARMYLEGNSDRVVRIGELAELTSFSSWYFSKTFHGLYDESPQAASARLRLERAAELLASSPMMIGEVAAACGFDNCCSFARAFRARHGMSASTYRHNARITAAMASRTDSANPAAPDRKAA